MMLNGMLRKTVQCVTRQLTIYVSVNLELAFRNDHKGQSSF